MEEAAASLGARPTAIFRRIVFPNLLPAILSGVALAFARAVGEFGAVVLISGNLPFKTEVASVYIFGRSSRTTRRRGRRLGRAAADLVRRPAPDRRASAAGRRGMTSPRIALLRFGVLGYLAALLLVPVGLVFCRDVRARLRARWDAVTTPEALHALWLTLMIAAIAVPAEHPLRRRLAIALVRAPLPRRGLLNAIVDLPLALSPVVVGLSLVLLYGRAAGSAASRTRSRSSSRCRRWSSRRCSSRCRSSCARSCRCCARSAPIRSRPPRRSARRRSRSSAGSRCRRSAGRSPTACPDDRARHRRVRRRERRLREHRGQDETLTLLVQAVTTFDIRARTRPPSCWR